MHTVNIIGIVCIIIGIVGFVAMGLGMWLDYRKTFWAGIIMLLVSVVTVAIVGFTHLR